MKKILLNLLLLILFSSSSLIALDIQEKHFVDHMEITQISLVSDSCILAFGDRVDAWWIVLRSRDKGETWDTLYYEPGSDHPNFKLYYSDYHAFSEEHLLAATSGGVLRVTKDGFESIENQKIPDSGQLRNLEMFDDNYGIMSSFSPGNLFITKDGCNTWDIIPNLNVLAPLEAKILEDKTICVIATSADYHINFYKTKDEGETWEKYPFPGTDILPSMFFIDTLNGWVTGGEKTGFGNQKSDILINTTDGGKTWQTVYNQLNEPQWGLEDIDFYDENVGLAVGVSGKILRTQDGGKTWNQEIWPDTTAPVRFTCLCISPTEALFGSIYGSIYKYDAVTGVKEVYSPQYSKIYPNPIETGSTLSLDIPFGTYQAKIFSLDGVLVQKNDQVSNSIQLHDDIVPGAYFIVIESNGKIIAREKFIVE